MNIEIYYIQGLLTYFALLLAFDYCQTIFHEQAHKRVFAKFGYDSKISYFKRQCETVKEVSEKDYKAMLPYHLSIDAIGYNIYALGLIICLIGGIIITLI